MAAKGEIPLYTKIGIRVTLVLALIIFLILLRNCSSAIYHGKNAGEEDIKRHYDAGYSVGSGETTEGAVRHEDDITNPFLLKSYQKGFRDGRDSLDKDILRGNGHDEK